MVLSMLLPALLLISACTNTSTQDAANSSAKVANKTSHTNKSEAYVKKTNGNESSKRQSNVITKPNKEAKATILNYYHYLEIKDYKSATALLGPQLKFGGTPKMIKYLKNIQKATFHKLIDISNEEVPDLYQYKKYYAVKIYYGEVDFKVKDPKLVPALTTTRYRDIYVIKEKKNDPWKIDMNSETDKRE